VKEENYAGAGHCSRAEAELKFVLKGGSQSLCYGQKIYCAVPKITVLAEYEMDFLRIYK